MRIGFGCIMIGVIFYVSNLCGANYSPDDFRVITGYSEDCLYITNQCSAKLVCGPYAIMGYGPWVMHSTYKDLPIVDIGDSAFSSSDIAIISIPAMMLPSFVTNIGAYAFQCVSNVPHIYLPDGLKRIGDAAFASCQRLVAITIPSEVQYIGARPFCGCASLASIVVDPENQWYSSLDGVLYDKNHNVLLAAPASLESVTLPPTLKTIGAYAFYDSKIRSCSMPDGVSCIDEMAFAHARFLLNVKLPESIEVIGNCAFLNCVCLSSFCVPPQVKNLGAATFGGCDALEQITFFGKPPLGIEDAGIPHTTLIRYPASLSPYWKHVSGNTIAFDDVESNPSWNEESIAIVTTNVVVHYVLNSIKSEIALPEMDDTGFVSIVAEVKGGAFAVPESWAAEYPGFTEKFGTDFTKALAMQTGKKDGAGNPMFVWQDYVAGTDPTDETDVFTASITIVDGKVKVSYSPELDDARKALRKYTTYGKAKLTDTEWTVVKEGEEDNFNFFKVTVEMK